MKLPKLLAIVAFAGLALAWFVLLRPVPLGGAASYQIVSGTSMEPQLRGGDLVIAHAQDVYEVGDVIVFRVPAGQQGGGSLVVHRIVGGDPTAGFVVQGDNKSEPDQWRPKASDIVGRSWLEVPGGGNILLISRRPLVLAALLGGLAGFWFLTSGSGGAASATRTSKAPRPGASAGSRAISEGRRTMRSPLLLRLAVAGIIGTVTAAAAFASGSLLPVSGGTLQVFSFPGPPTFPTSPPPTPMECAGLAFDEVLVGTPGDDVFIAANGGALIFGLGGDDWMHGGNAKDCLVGGEGNDTLAGGNGKDVLLGEDGDDLLLGGGDDDVAEGGNGKDRLDGGDGVDDCVGTDKDTYVDCESTDASESLQRAAEAVTESVTDASASATPTETPASSMTPTPVPTPAVEPMPSVAEASASTPEPTPTTTPTPTPSASPSPSATTEPRPSGTPEPTPAG